MQNILDNLLGKRQLGQRKVNIETNLMKISFSMDSV